MTAMQEVVGRFWNIYPDGDFIEMVQQLDDPDYWQNIDLESLTDSECVDVLNRLSDIYSQWNNA